MAWNCSTDSALVVPQARQCLLVRRFSIGVPNGLRRDLPCLLMLWIAIGHSSYCSINPDSTQLLFAVRVVESPDHPVLSLDVIYISHRYTMPWLQVRVSCLRVNQWRSLFAFLLVACFYYGMTSWEINVKREKGKPVKYLNPIKCSSYKPCLRQSPLHSSSHVSLAPSPFDSSIFESKLYKGSCSSTTTGASVDLKTAQQFTSQELRKESDFAISRFRHYHDTKSSMDSPNFFTMTF